MGKHSLEKPNTPATAAAQPATAAEQPATAAAQPATAAEQPATAAEQPIEEKSKEKKSLVQDLALGFAGFNMLVIIAATAVKSESSSISQAAHNLLGATVEFALVSLLIWVFLLILLHVQPAIAQKFKVGAILSGGLTTAIGCLFFGMSYWA